ncbi:MAG: permease prefix domain 2-containing transporter, partial [Longimicrobiales bacterium]
MKPQATPPRLARRLLERALPADVRDDVSGDLDEVFRRRCENRGARRARLWYWSQAVSFSSRFLRERLRERGRSSGNPFAAHAPRRIRGREVMAGGMSWLDFKLGLRMLVKYPGLTVVGTLAIAVAIALSAAYVEFVNDIWHPTIPLENGDRIVGIQNWNAATSRADFRSLHDFVTWRDELASVEELGAYRTISRNLITADERAEPIDIAEISASAFRLVGIAPLLGRPLLETDEQTGASPVIVIGYGIWQTRFGADPGVIGRTVR